MPALRLLFFSIALFYADACLSQEFSISDILVEGLQRISVGTVFSHVDVAPGEQLTRTKAQRIVRDLYSTGFFDDVRLERSAADLLVIHVKERPAISEINFSGNESIGTEALEQGLAEQGLARRQTFNRSVMDAIEKELRRQYFDAGKYAVEIKVSETPLERNRVAINIDIVEGETATIKGINIVGNQAFSEDELLDLFASRVTGWYHFFSRSDQYSKQQLAGDLETLKSFYLDRGHIGFRVLSTQVDITPDKQDIYISISISEGEVFTISDISLAGHLVQPAEELFPMIRIRRGEPFSRHELVEAEERISNSLSNLGYAFANINSIPEIDRENKQVAVTFFVDPGNRVYVRQINVRGHHRTRDRVIRQELRQMESAWFSNDKVSLSKDRLQRTDFFESVSVETPSVAGATDLMDINFSVKEKPSGAILAGIGFSQTSGVILNASLTEKNFFGSGKRVNFAINNGSASTRYELGVFDPYYTIDGISRGFSAGFRTTDYEELNSADYSTDVGRITVNFGLPLSEFNRFNFGFGLETIGLKTGTGVSNEIDDFITQEGEDYLNFKLTGSWRHDSRDSAFFPTAGVLQRVALESSLPGSDLQYFKVHYENRYYLPVTDAMTFSVGGKIGYGAGYGDTGDLPFFENWFAGGFNSVRGYRANTLGPRDSNDDPIGGNLLTVGNFELLFAAPFEDFRDNLRLAAFFDIGNVFDQGAGGFEFDELRYSVGVGFSWLSPIGALSLSYAQALEVRASDEEESFQFNLGKTF